MILKFMAISFRVCKLYMIMVINSQKKIIFNVCKCYSPASIETLCLVSMFGVRSCPIQCSSLTHFNLEITSINFFFHATFLTEIAHNYAAPFWNPQKQENFSYFLFCVSKFNRIAIKCKRKRPYLIHLNLGNVWSNLKKSGRIPKWKRAFCRAIFWMR